MIKYKFPDARTERAERRKVLVAPNAFHTDTKQITIALNVVASEMRDTKAKQNN